jgi:hypothetical protein
MALDPDKLQAIINAGDVAACLAFFQGASEADRKAIAKTALDHLRALRNRISAPLRRLATRIGFVPSVPGLTEPSEVLPDAFEAARVAVLASASLSQLKKLGFDGIPAHHAYTILADRRPPWLDEMVELMCELERRLRFGSHWPSVRRLVREGLCRAPQNPGYIEGMLRTLSDENGRRHTDIETLLRKDPGLLQDEIWRIFELEPSPGRWLQLPGTWSYALAELSRDGAIPRDRLLDATLDGLERDFHELRARWFATLHEHLVPTIPERSSRSARYLGLLSSRNPSTIAFALKALKPMDNAEQLDPHALAASIGPALQVRVKGTVKLALQLLDAAAGRNRDALSTTQVAAVAAEALVHEAPEVQELALDLILRHGDPADAGLKGLLVERAGALAPSQRNRLEAWLGTTPTPSPATAAAPSELDTLIARANALEPRWSRLAGVPEAIEALRDGRDLSALTFDGIEIPRLDPARALVPIQDLDELIDLLARLIEGPGSPEDIELALDGVSRLCDQRPEEFAARTEPLVARARHHLEKPTSAYLVALGKSICQLVTRWVTGEVHRREVMGLSLFDLIARRIQSIARRAATGQAAPLLSAPTHAGGWIDPRVLVERVRRRTRARYADDDFDMELALLRLAPEHRDSALREAAGLAGDFGAALRYALGAEDEPIGPTASLWAAAARARAPWSDDLRVEQRHPNLGPDAALAARYILRVGREVRERYRRPAFDVGRQPSLAVERWCDLPTLSLHNPLHLVGCDVPWAATAWPMVQEPLFATAAEFVAQNERGSMDAKFNQPFLLRLLDPDVPMKPMARLLLVTGLNAPRPELSGLATDALIAAIDDGRLDGLALGSALTELGLIQLDGSLDLPPWQRPAEPPPPIPFVKLNRWAKTLTDAARASSLHAGVIALALLYLIRANPFVTQKRSNLLPLLVLFKELLIETGQALSDPEARAVLARLETSGQTATVIKAILKFEAAPNHGSKHAAAAHALARRIERAERWNSCNQAGQ